MGAFSWLMVDLERPGSLEQCPPQAGGPRVSKKARCELASEQASEQPSSLASHFPSDRLVWFGGVVTPLGAGDSGPSGLEPSFGRNTWHLSSIKVTRVVEFFLSENCL